MANWIQAYPGICLHDQDCWGNPRGQVQPTCLPVLPALSTNPERKSYQYYRTPDTSPRAYDIYGEDPPDWDFTAQQPADLVVINIGTNDNNPANNVPGADYYNDYVTLVEHLHAIWPDAQVVLMVSVK